MIHIGEDVENGGPFCTIDGNVGDSKEFPQKLKNKATRVVNLLLSVHLEEIKSLS